MNPEQDVHGLGAEIAELTTALEAERTTGRRATMSMLIGNVALVLIVGGFMLSNYMYLSKEWSRDNFARSFEKEALNLTPLAMDQLVALGEHLLPVYATEAQKQLVAVAPKLERTLSRELEAFGRGVHTALSAQIEQTDVRVRARLDTVLSESFPELQTAEDKARFVEAFSGIMADSLARLHLDVEGRYGKQLDELRETIVKLDVEDRGEPTWELQKRFIHLWLLLIDEEVMKL